MTLIIDIITEEKTIKICDKMHSIDGTIENPVKATLKMGNSTIHMQAPKIRINSGTKILQLNDNTIIGGAGVISKIELLKSKIPSDLKDTIFNFFDDYYFANKSDSPDELTVSYKTTNTFYTKIYRNISDEYSSYFYSYNFYPISDKIVVAAIGSGSSIFLPIYTKLRNDNNQKYNKAKTEGTLTSWENDFIALIKRIFEHISLYDDSVSKEIELYSLHQ
ncbi:hypothetical protein CH364_09795 [Leptospira harrisiae]|uniref:Uncharacterized protein n=1 Tax=Leptospira harrisiae TaxID=2023189 RepID=A0A2N0AQI5_9LEPT|nr:hypothetical protein [Leptospira harrisiae]PJZ86431.1 hypothetical protein CH364_09795 [Leptospira harrisiae]